MPYAPEGATGKEEQEERRKKRVSRKIRCVYQCITSTRREQQHGRGKPYT
jgi:hypothetical protein